MPDIEKQQLKAKEWADSVIEAVLTDDRSFIKGRDSRPVTDLKDMLTSSTKLYGERPAYLQKFPGDKEFTEITYQQTYDDVNALGTALIARGFKGKRIAVIGENSYHWAISYLATVCGVGTVVPMDKELSAKELANQVKRADVSCVMFDKKRRPIFQQIKADGGSGLEMLVGFTAIPEDEGLMPLSSLIEEGRALLEQGNTEFLDAKIDFEAMGIMLFTSGTTGKSKCVMLSHKNLCTQLMTAPAIFDLNETDRYLSILPFHHTYESTCSFLMSLYRGASVAFCQGLRYIASDMKEVQPTMILGVPALFEKLYSTIWKTVEKKGKTKTLIRAIKANNKTKNFGKNVEKLLNKIPDGRQKEDDDAYFGALRKLPHRMLSEKVGGFFGRNVGLDLSHTLFADIHKTFGGKIKSIICGGAAINPEVLEGFQSFGINAFQGYGLTECSPLAAFNPQDAPIAKSVGVPLPTMEIKAVDLDEDGVGELCVRGDHVMIGYYEMPEETAAAIDEDGWFHTGDLGYVDDNGYVYISGRKKNVIITKNGKNVFPEEIEYNLSKVSFIEESYVFQDSNAKGDDTVIVASVLLDEEEADKHLGAGYTDEEAKKLIWEAVDIMNDMAPAYRKIKRVVLRKTPYIKSSTQKILRFEEANKLEQ